MSHHATQVIAIVSGSGGVGKTTIATNLAFALAGRGRRVALLESSPTASTVAAMIGVDPARSVRDLLDGRASLRDVTLPVTDNLVLLPGPTGVAAARRTIAQLAGLIAAFDAIAASLDVLIVDTVSGASDDSLLLAAAATDVVVTVNDDPLTTTSTCNLVDALYRSGVHRAWVLANRANHPGSDPCAATMAMALRHCDVVLRAAGQIPDDTRMRRATVRRRPIVELYPEAPSSVAFGQLATATTRWLVPAELSGRVAFFAGSEAEQRRSAR